MSMQSTFEFLSAQGLLEEFVQKTNVLQFLEKEDLVCLIEQLLIVQQHKLWTELDDKKEVTSTETHVSVGEVESFKFAVDKNYRQNLIKLTHEEVLSKLTQDGVVSFGSFSKRDVNILAKMLGLIECRYNQKTKLWYPTEKGANIGVTSRNNAAVHFSIEAYDLIKNYLLN